MKKIFFLLFSFLALGLACQALGAQFFFQDEKIIGPYPEATLYFDSQGEEINALELGMFCPPEDLQIRELKSGNSLIPFFLEGPKTQNNFVSFSGIIPGGFLGQGPILTLTFLPEKTGPWNCQIKKFQILKNDGQGTPLSLASQEIILNQPSRVVPEQKDTLPPEEFFPVLTRQENIFQGQWFLSFATQDKQSGISHYEIKEVPQKFFWFQRKGDWQKAESPYLLKNQNLNCLIYLKAVDFAGNERVVVFNPSQKIFWFKDFVVFGILILGVLFLALGKILWQVRKKLF